MSDELIYFGEAVKALGDGKVGGYLVRYSTDADPDLTGQYFGPDTDYGDAETSPVYYNHALDPVIKKRKLGRAELRRDDAGIWAEAQLKLRDEYDRAIYELAQAGKLGWSSGTASHLVEIEPRGKAEFIKSWPLGLDASLTPTPAEPRNSALPLKSITVEPLAGDTPTDAPALESAEQDGKEPQPVKAGKSNNETATADSEELTMDEKEIQKLIDDAVAAKMADIPKPEPIDVKAEVEAGVEAALKKLPGIKTDIKVVKDEADQDWESGGEFLQAVKTASLYPGTEDPRLRGLKATGLSENVPADGGYLLAPQFASGVIQRMYDVGQVLSRVANTPIGPNSNGMNFPYIDESSRADGSRFGGVRGYWVAEAASITASKPTFGQMELRLKKVAALCHATEELLSDATALESWLMTYVPQELRFKVEDAIVNGDGVGKPLGLMNSPAINAILRIDANEVDGTDLVNMYSRAWHYGGEQYVWLINTSVFPQLAVATIGNQPALLQYNAPLAGSVSNLSILGYPVVVSEYTKALGTQGDIILADMSQYQTITKGGIQSASSIHVQFAAAETAFRFIYRIDGQPMWQSTLTPFDGGNALSPFVVLSAASA